MTLHQLQVFVTIADAGSIRAAAERLVVSQPAVSATLASLERIVGVDLVAKAGRGIQLTDSGRVMERYARLLLSLVDEAVAAAQFASDPIAAPVRIGATTAAAEHVVAPLLQALRRRRPDAQFAVEVGNRARVWELLESRSIDVAITTRPPITESFQSLGTHLNDLVLATRPGVVWAGRLGDATWLIREPGSSTRAATEEVIALLGITPPTITIGSNAAILSAAEGGLGVALLPAMAVASALAARTLVLVHAEPTPLKRPWHMVVRAGESLSRSVEQFVDDLRAESSAFTWSPASSSSASPVAGDGSK